MGKLPCEILKNTYFKEHLHTAGSELTLRSIVWNFVSGSHLKPSRLSNITKIPITFKSKLSRKLGDMVFIYLIITLSSEPRFRMFIINGSYTKSSLWTSC